MQNNNAYTAILKGIWRCSMNWLWRFAALIPLSSHSQRNTNIEALYAMPGDEPAKTYLGSSLGVRGTVMFANPKHHDWHFGVAMSALPFAQGDISYTKRLAVFHKGLQVGELPAAIDAHISNQLYVINPAVRFCPEQGNVELYLQAALGLAWLHNKITLHDVSVTQWYVNNDGDVQAPLVLTKNVAPAITLDIGCYAYSSQNIKLYAQAGITFTGNVGMMNYNNINQWKLEFLGEQYDGAQVAPQTIALRDARYQRLNTTLFLYQFAIGVQLKQQRKH